MPVDILVDKWEVKSTDYLDLKNFYIALHAYLWREEYSVGRDTEFPETYYWETRTQEGGKEIWVWWRPKKTVAGSRFYLRTFVVDIHGVGIKDTEVMRAGKKWKVDTGKVEILVKAKLQLDPYGEWEKNPFLKTFLKVFYKRIYKKQIEKHKQELLTDSKKFQEEVKRLFELNTFATPIRPYASRRGIMPDEY